MSIGIWQLILILVLVLLFFGTGKLPKVMSEIGKGLKSLKNSIKDDKKDNTGKK
jgi:sec-independent protein translocase protein TatA|tara:strand:+ start:4094 stop:4255 length:162 start_codon:yes stop_codon:yes gene_type:complete